MNVNTTVYGDPSTWFPQITPSTSETAIAENAMFYIANFGGATNASRIAKAYYNGRQLFNKELDRSIAVVGVDDNCILTDQAYINVQDFANETSYSSFSEFCRMKKQGTNPLCYMMDRSVLHDIGYPLTSSTYNRYYSGYDQEIQPETNTSTTYFNLSPVTKVPLATISWVIIVKCTSTNPLTDRLGSNITFDLYTYCNADITNSDGVTKKCYEWYPTIVYVAVVPYQRTNRVINDDDPITTVYRRTDSSALNFYPCIMGGYTQTIDPYTGGAPYQLLTYYQPQTTTDKETEGKGLPIYSNPDNNTPSTFTMNCGVAMMIGTRNGNTTYDRTYKYQYVGFSKLKCRIWLDGNIVRSNIWTDVATYGTIDDFYNFWLSQTAYLGGYFTDSYDIAIRAKRWNIPHTFIGTIDDDGITHGEYTQGEENETQKQYEWDDYTQNNYNPDAKPEAPDVEQPSDPWTWGTKGVPMITNYYWAADNEKVQGLQTWAKQILNPPGPWADVGDNNPPQGSYKPEDLAYDIERKFSGVYPAGNILSIMWFPIDIQKATSSGGPQFPIIVGNTSASNMSDWYGGSVDGVNAYPVYGYPYVTMDSTGYQISEYFGDFRDYQPYTTMDLEIPWHGTISIDPGHWYGHTLSVRIIIDIITGASCAYIIRDNVVIQSIDGQIGVPINFNIRNIGDWSSTTIAAAQNMNQQRYDNAKTYISSITQAAGGLAKVAAGVATQNYALAIPGAIQAASVLPDVASAEEKMQNVEFAVGHTPSGSTQISTQSPSISQRSHTDLRLIIKRPHLLPGYNAAQYGSSVGFACNMQGTIGSFSGFTVFSGADLDGLSVIEPVKQLIYSQLQSGLII